MNQEQVEELIEEAENTLHNHIRRDLLFVDEVVRGDCKHLSRQHDQTIRPPLEVKEHEVHHIVDHEKFQLHIAIVARQKHFNDDDHSLIVDVRLANRQILIADQH